MKSTRSNTSLTRMLQGLALSSIMLGLCVGDLTPAALAQTKGTTTIKRSESGTDQDVLVLKDGTTLTGTIVSEDKTKIRFKRIIAGIPFEEDVDLKSVVEIKKASKKPDAAADSKPAPGATPSQDPGTTPTIAETPSQGVVGNGDGTAYYWISLKGPMGRGFSQTPFRKMIQDAKANKADVIVIELDGNHSRQEGGDSIEDFANRGRNVDLAMRVEPITAVVTSEMPAEWEKLPRMVCWVRDAMGPVAPLPFIFKEIYLASNASIGGLGGLETIFDGVGDEVVREKQRSLRMGHLEGLVLAGGYDYRIMRGMTRREIVLTLGYDEDGNATLLERAPENPSEEILTDDGAGANQDSAADVIRNRGNDYLRLDARTALLLNVSKGTVDTRDELLDYIGLSRSGKLIEGKAKRIATDWSNQLNRAEQRLKKALADLRDVRVEAPGDYAARQKARARQKSLLEEMKRLLEQYEEGLSPQFLRDNEIPGIPQIEDLLNRIKTDGLLDKK